MNNKDDKKEIDGIRHIIENSLQHDNEIDDIMHFNAENDYMYDIVSDNLVDSRIICKLLRFGYVIMPYYDNLVLRHQCRINKKRG